MAVQYPVRLCARVTPEIRDRILALAVRMNIPPAHLVAILINAQLPELEELQNEAEGIAIAVSAQCPF